MTKPATLGPLGIAAVLAILALVLSSPARLGYTDPTWLAILLLAAAAACLVAAVLWLAVAIVGAIRGNR